MTPARIGSICSGYGGLEMAAELALGPTVTVWHAEVDPDASRVLDTRWPGVPNHGDITAVDWRRVEPVDVLCAGFPCQTVSAAGRQLGDGDERWLWERPGPDGAVGVIAAIRILQPATVVIENVANLVSFQGGRLFRTVLADLRTAGYAVRWAVAGACTAWACHHRHRVFVLARYVGSSAPEAIRVAMPACGPLRSLLPTPKTNDMKGAGLHGDGGTDLRTAVSLLPTPAARDGDGRGEGSADYWQRRTDEMGRTNGMPLGAALALLPTLGRGAGTPSTETAQARIDAGRRYLDDAVALLPTPRATDGTKGGPNQRGSSGDLMLPSAVQPQRWGQYAAAVARWATVHGAPPEPVEPNSNGAWRLAARFPEWMMGLPAGWVTDICDRNDALRLIGNGVMPQQGGHVLRLLRDDEDAPSDLLGLLAAS